jgi:Asp-tRNA(Asn)/Glu-tRNA(Gln) amidotransferase A subunit family amidase
MSPQFPRPRVARARTALAAAVLALSVSVVAVPAASAADLDLATTSIDELRTAVADGRVSCRVVVQGELDRIAAYDQQGPALNAVITTNAAALADADAIDAKRRLGLPLGDAGCVPVVLKDNIETGGLRTTFGSTLFANWVPDADAPIVADLRREGAIVLAKGNLDDWAAAVYGTSDIAGDMHNPYDPTRTTGGSSGGPAVSVAAGYAPLAIGTDTGGSLRIPAAFNSVVTIRPTMGLVSRTGISPRALTQDTAGPLARTVADAAEGLDLIAGPDPQDPLTSRGARHVPAAGYASYAKGGRLDGVRIGVIREGIPLWGDIQPALSALEEQAIDDLEALGATVVDLPQSFVDRLDRGFACNDCLLDSGVIGQESRRDLTAFLQGLSPTPPASSFDELYNVGDYAGRYTIHAKESFDREATVDLQDPDDDPDAAATYQTNLDRQAQLREATLGMLSDQDLDAVIYPSATWFPDPIGTEQSGVFTRWSEQTGFPAIGVPMGYGRPTDNPSTQDLPASLEFLGGPFDEPGLIRIAAAYQEASDRRRVPPTTPATTVPLADPPAAETPATPSTPTTPSTPPAAPAPTPVPTPVTAKRAKGLSAKTTPTRDRTWPLRFTTTGRLTLPAGVARARGCARGSTVTVRVTRAGATVSARRVRLSASCTYRSTVTFRSKARMGRATRLRVAARFSGNAYVRPISARAATVRIR